MSYPPPNPKGCTGFHTYTSDGHEFDCEYDTPICCSDCRYGKHGGRLDPEVHALEHEKEYEKVIKHYKDEN